MTTPYQKTVNGYSYYYNTMWELWIVSHSEIGFCGQFDNEEDAIDYCKAG